MKDLISGEKQDIYVRPNAKSGGFMAFPVMDPAETILSHFIPWFQQSQ
jgi:hypothetical protein